LIFETWKSKETAMFANYLKIALRNLKKHKAYSLVNLLGLTIGIACCILILLYIVDELSFDRFHTKSDRIYRIVETHTAPNQSHSVKPSELRTEITNATLLALSKTFTSGRCMKKSAPLCWGTATIPCRA